MRRALLLLPLLCLAPARAGESVFPIEPRGLRAVGIAFYGAMAEPTGTQGEVRVAFGELDELLWDDSTLPTLDVRVFVANTARLNLPQVDAKLSIYLGRAPMEALPPPEAIVPGAAGIEESLFFERTYEIPDVRAGGLGSMLVPQVQLRQMVEDLMRQKQWPVYVRGEVTVSERSGEVKVVQPSATSFLRIVPRARP